MEQSLQAKTNDVAFRRPTFNRDMARLGRRILRGLERVGRARAAHALKMYGYHDHAEELLKGYWTNA